MIVSPRSSHSFWILVIRNDVVEVGELFVADRANPILLDNLPVEEFPHLGRRSQFPISTRMMRIFNSLNSQPDHPGCGYELPPTARRRSVNRTDLVGAQSPGGSPVQFGLISAAVQRHVARRESRQDLTVHVFHNSIHRYFVFTLRIALTPIKQLFSLAGVDG